MSLPNFGRSAVRAAKNYTKGFLHAQIKARNATCNDPWPPSGKEMFELAQMTYRQGDFIDIMEVIDKRLNDKGKNWRHVFKSLVVLDYLLHSGSENVIVYCEENLYEIKTLREFQYIDEEGRDQGANVRQKAKDITNLLMDKRRLHQERVARSRMRDRMLGRTSTDTDDDDEGGRPPYRRPVTKPPLGTLSKKQDEEDENLRRAIEESKRDAQARSTAEDRDLQRAIELSKEDEERRRRLVDLAANGVFDDTVPSGADAPLIDLDGPAQTIAIQPQFTPMQPQYTSIQPQFTSLQPQFTSIQPQFTSFNPYLQQAQQEAMQQEYLRQQAEYARHQLEAEALAAAQQAQLLLQQQQQLQPQPLSPQRTAFGSNNPFIAGPSSPTIPERPITSPPHNGPVSFNLTGTYEGRRPATSFDEGRERREASRPYSASTEPRRRGLGEENERLANLFANYTGDGVDTFGNTGPLRFGQTEYGRLAAQKTGAVTTDRTGVAANTKNPFLMESPQRVTPAPASASTSTDAEGNLIEL
ncbi:ENTH-domain-containing protein [Dichomitus squalens]|nr:ENTH-domain-containing protein [Dichomitus squalens]